MLQHGSGKFPVHAEIERLVYAKGNGSGRRDEVGEVLYNRGLIGAMLGVEAIRTAQEKFGKKPLTGEQVRWRVEKLDLSEARLKELGFGDMIKPNQDFLRGSLWRPKRARAAVALTGEQVRWGVEKLDLSEARLKELGFGDMIKPIKISCADHSGGRSGRVQQWDGQGWKIISDWYTADETLTEPIVRCWPTAKCSLSARECVS